MEYQKTKTCLTIELINILNLRQKIELKLMMMHVERILQKVKSQLKLR